MLIYINIDIPYTYDIVRDRSFSDSGLFMLKYIFDWWRKWSELKCQRSMAEVVANFWSLLPPWACTASVFVTSESCIFMIQTKWRVFWGSWWWWLGANSINKWWWWCWWLWWWCGSICRMSTKYDDSGSENGDVAAPAAAGKIVAMMMVSSGSDKQSNSCE